MDFLEIEESIVNENHDMAKPHSHEHFELYFLFDGKREFFIDNKMFVVDNNTLVIVPPFSIHKTEGGPFKRINVNISANLLTKTQLSYLDKLSKKTAVKISADCLPLVKGILQEGARIQKSGLAHKKEYLLSFIHSAIYILSNHKLTPVSFASNASYARDNMTDALKIIYYVNKNYMNGIKLKTICDEFYLSKVTVCKMFKDFMNCSVMKYVQGLKLNKARELLVYTSKSIEEVSRICGFSSANYFGLTFKKETGMSPFYYRKSK